MGAELTTLARDPAAPRFRILSVAAGGTLILNGLTIRGGNQLSGAGVRNAGTVIITNSTVAGNSDEAILSFGDMTIDSSTIADNSGVGISNGGVMTITNSTIADNSDNGIGNGGNLTINNSAITGNAKHCREFFASCAGIDNFEAALTINNSTIAANGVGNSIGAGIQSGHGGVRITDSISCVTAAEAVLDSTAPSLAAPLPCRILSSPLIRMHPPVSQAIAFSRASQMSCPWVTT